jgi:hypothetical protein
VRNFYLYVTLSLIAGTSLRGFAADASHAGGSPDHLPSSEKGSGREVVREPGATEEIFNPLEAGEREEFGGLIGKFQEHVESTSGLSFVGKVGEVE